MIVFSYKFSYFSFLEDNIYSILLSLSVCIYSLYINLFMCNYKEKTPVSNSPPSLPNIEELLDEEDEITSDLSPDDLRKPAELYG